MTGRLVKTTFVCAVGLYITLVCFNNLTDYPSNFAFVRMVTKMDDTFSKAHNGWRAIHNSGLHHFLFLVIIAWELTVAVLLVFGAIQMVQKYKAPAIDFKKAKATAALGLALGVLLWFVVFIAIGGEWFLMWQSKNWNAQPTAFFLTCSFLLFLIFLNQEDA